MKSELLFKEESYLIIGACFEVYREKGCGFLEPVYQECMEIELRLQGVPFVSQKPLTLEYKGCPLRSKYEPDFICYEKIVLELKAVTELAEEHRAQAWTPDQLWSLSESRDRKNRSEKGRYAHSK